MNDDDRPETAPRADFKPTEELVVEVFVAPTEKPTPAAATQVQS